MDKKFCENLKSYRKMYNMTQKQVADKLYVIESCYANWEQGRAEPSISMMRQICKLFDISIDELFN